MKRIYTRCYSLEEANELGHFIMGANFEGVQNDSYRYCKEQMERALTENSRHCRDYCYIGVNGYRLVVGKNKKEMRRQDSTSYVRKERIFRKLLMKPELVAFINANHNNELNSHKMPFLTAGCANGYVAIPPEHPCYRKDYLESPIDEIPVHGGITYSEPACYEDKTFMSKREIRPEYIGTRSCLFEDAEYISNSKNIPDNWWILGFDTCHYGDNPANWTRENVIAETLKLKKHLEDLWRG